MTDSEAKPLEDEELRRLRVVAEDGTWLTAIESRHVHWISTKRGPRRMIGARHWRLSTGEALTVVDRQTFCNAETGEILSQLDARP